jgi:hypothetical protein
MVVGIPTGTRDGPSLGLPIGSHEGCPEGSCDRVAEGS